MYPENFRYTKEHEWVLADGDTGTIGITDHAQAELGDIVYVDLPKVGTRVEAGKSLGSVESVKAVSDIYSPVSGEIVEINESLADAPDRPGGEHFPNPVEHRVQRNTGFLGDLHKRLANEALDFIFTDRKDLRVDGIGVFDFAHE